MRLTSSTLDSRTVVSVAGEVDHLTAARVGDELGVAVLSGARWVEADFSRVGFCDCAGLNVLLAARSHFRDAGVQFSMSGPVAPAVERLFQLTGTGPLLREAA
ncbi:STAS domain-containing protein [Streptomyces sp. NPDC051104]|uniref:STAS domain-containing protein n=1 Tax=Streptomyces sp. NPDC051104 TaxID=3155044 RepID=UPI0034491471